MNAGELLGEARRRHGLTQRELATRARTSQAAISRIERGRVSPGVDTLADLLWLMNERLELGAEPVDWGHDATLNAASLALPAHARIARQASWSRGMKRIRDAARA